MKNEDELESQQDQSEMVDKPEDSGRGTDTVLAHLSLGELVIPRAFLDDPQVMQVMQAIFQAAETDINEFIVGHEANKINPETGYPEFFFKKLKKVFKKIAPFAALALNFIPGFQGIGAALGSSILGAGAAGASTLGNALISGGLGALSGGAKGGLIGALSGGLGANIGNIGTAASGLGNNISGALSGFGNATGISDLYNGSALQGAFKSGSDALSSIGINTGSDSLSAGIGASTGGGTSSYGDTTLPWLNNSTSGATQVSGSNYASPISSALLGAFTNNKAEEDLLKQQQANQALYSPYQNFQFNPGDLTQDPGYQFNLAQGNQALDRAQLARGGYFSGSALKEAQDYGQGLADNTYNTAFNRALQTNQEGLRGAGAMAGVNDNIGNIRANSTVNTGNLFSGALGSILGGNSFTNSGALQGGGSDYLSRLLRQLQMQGAMA